MTAIIIGAGASGLACAVRLKQNMPECEVIVLERMDTPGKKILATGNGRCNFSNLCAKHSNIVVDFFNGLGLKERADEEGRLYPYSNQASTVLDTLIESCEKSGVEIITDCTVTAIDRDLCVTTDCGMYMADCIVVACGGTAQKNLGSNGSGYDLLKSIGHKITPICPALVQLTSPSKYPRALKGQRVKCNMTVLLDGESVESEYGEVLFADYGLSGIVTMNLSHIVSENFASPDPKKCSVSLDLIPDMSFEEVLDYLNRFGNLKGILGRKMSDIIIKRTDGDIQSMAKVAKSWQLIINGTRGYDFAQITEGGADLNDFDDFESKKVKGVYACGEVLDRQFPCGGFNLNFAFYSGIAVADKIAGKQ
ncbi:MAG: aminoacetone oxidase family FAD-binding enzyme [Eubacteriales bacterium]|nr:aminoacetone oxidase family FAD-binding enzyme [Eubacteriales bacterium]